MEVLGVIPARGGSKSVPRKNVKMLAGEPLISYTIREGLAASGVGRLVVSTEDDEIADCALELGAEVPYRRHPSLAGDRVEDLPVFVECLKVLEREGYRPDVIVHLRPTAPLRRARDIDSCIDMLLASPRARCVRSVAPVAQHPLKMWRLEGSFLRPFVDASAYGIAEAYNKPRQSLTTAYAQNGAVDVVYREVIEGGSMTAEPLLGYVMAEEDSVNIDSAIDWEMAELLMQRRKADSGLVEREEVL